MKNLRIICNIITMYRVSYLLLFMAGITYGATENEDNITVFNEDFPKECQISHCIQVSKTLRNKTTSTSLASIFVPNF